MATDFASVSPAARLKRTIGILASRTAASDFAPSLEELSQARVCELDAAIRAEDEYALDHAVQNGFEALAFGGGLCAARAQCGIDGIDGAREGAERTGFRALEAPTRRARQGALERGTYRVEAADVPLRDRVRERR